MNYRPNDIVKSCRRLESGLRIGIEGIHACQLGQLSSPMFWSIDEAKKTRITREMIVEKRKWLFGLLNDGHGDIACRGCHQAIEKRFDEVDFTKLGRMDIAPTSMCNLRCAFCGYAKNNAIHEWKYDALSLLKEFSPEDVEWDSAVDFNGGEPALLSDLDEYLDFFASRRIRVLLYTNAVKYRPSIYDGLAKGTIQWVCTSVDAGSPSSFKRLKKRDCFLQVLENLSRYAHAGGMGGGMLAVKYIFCEDNCTDDDVTGFTYAMLAIRPQKVWLTFDFEPLCNLRGNSADFGGYDYSKHISAYAKMYTLMKKHGLTPVHYTEGHLARVSEQGRILLDRVLSEISRIEAGSAEIPGVLLGDFRRMDISDVDRAASFRTGPLRVREGDGEPRSLSLSGKRVILAPACQLTTALLQDPEIREAQIAGFVDRDPMLRGKSIEGISIFGYDDIPALAPDFILTAPPKQHRDDILGKLGKFAGPDTKIAVLDTTDNRGGP